MAAVSKRQQARNERELQELLRLPGNSQCADCGARNPGWASWSLGIFVCMRCASIHRKLGTHISKVKSLSMDTWNTNQVENMKRNGNTAANNIYNPKNKRPDIPLDADEVDSAMERFIRKKYQEKSLADGRPEPPHRSESVEYTPPVPSKSPDSSPPPPVPSKKGRFFGFGLRASSSAYPLSKYDKKKLPPEPRVESAWTIDSGRVGQSSRMDDARAPIGDAELQRKSLQLKDMGFADTERNTAMLRRLNGNVERTVEALVQLGPTVGQRSSSVNVASEPTALSRNNATPAAAPDSVQSTMQSSTTSNNPWDVPSTGQAFGISMAPPQQPQATGASYGSNNPFDQPVRSQTDAGLAQAFGGMQISQPAAQPLFPHSTGGYPLQQPQIPNPRLQTMTPPIPSFSQQQFGYVASPPVMGSNTNPFFQNMQLPQMQSQLQPQMTAGNPFFSQMQQPQQQQVTSPSSTNPFMSSAPQQQPVQQLQSSLGPGYNPFGIPPSGQSPPQTSQGQVQIQSMQTGFHATSQPSSMSPTNPFHQQVQPQGQQLSQLSPQLPNFQYGQPQQQAQQQQQDFSQYQNASNPYSAFPQSPPQFQQAAQTFSLTPQQTGRYDKQSIMALYNYPQLAPAKSRGLSSIPEPTGENGQAQDVGQPKRSVTMPISMGSMHSAGGAGMASGNRNPFMQNSMGAATPQHQTAQQAGVMARHVSQESVSINNLEHGRHSPDAFANLSARYVG